MSEVILAFQHDMEQSKQRKKLEEIIHKKNFKIFPKAVIDIMKEKRYCTYEIRKCCNGEKKHLRIESFQRRNENPIET